MADKKILFGLLMISPSIFAFVLVVAWMTFEGIIVVLFLAVVGLVGDYHYGKLSGINFNLRGLLFIISFVGDYTLSFWSGVLLGVNTPLIVQIFGFALHFVILTLLIAGVPIVFKILLLTNDFKIRKQTEIKENKSYLLRKVGGRWET